MKKIIRGLLKEYWSQQPDKWDLLEMDVRTLTDKIIEKHLPNWGSDETAVIDAIRQVFDGMFQPVAVNESVSKFKGEKDKLVDSEDTIVGHQSIIRWGDTPGYYGEKISSGVFFKIVKAIVNGNSFDELNSWSEVEMDERADFLDSTLKLFGMESNVETTGLSNKAFHTSLLNYDGLKNNTITQMSELDIPNVETYRLYVTQDVTEWIEYQFSVTVGAYSESDAEKEVEQDEDNIYQWYEYEDSDNFEKEVTDTESRGIDVTDIEIE